MDISRANEGYTSCGPVVEMSWHRAGVLLLGAQSYLPVPGVPAVGGIGSVLLSMARMGWKLCHVFRLYTVVEKFSSEDSESLSYLTQKVGLHQQRFAEARKNSRKINHVYPYMYGSDGEDDDSEIAAAEWVRSKKVIPYQWVKNSGKEERYDFDITKADKIFDLLVREKQIQLPAGHTIPSAEELGKKRYCKWHNSGSHTTNDCKVFRQQIQTDIEGGKIKFDDSKRPMKVDGNPFPVNMVHTAGQSADSVRAKGFQVNSAKIINKYQRKYEKQQEKHYEEHDDGFDPHWGCEFFRFCWNEGMRLPSIENYLGCNDIIESSSQSYNRSNRLRQERVSVRQRLGPVNQGRGQEDDVVRTNQWCPSSIFMKNQKRRVQRLRNRERLQEVEQEINHRLKKAKPRQELRVKNQIPIADDVVADEAKRLAKGKSVVVAPINMTRWKRNRLSWLSPEQAVFEKPEGTENRHLKPLYINGYVNGKPMPKMMVDGGAAVNLMPYATFKKLGRNAENLIKTNMVLKDFGGNPSETKGVLNVELTVGSKTIPTTFFVIDGKGSYSLLLGRDWIHANCCIPSTMHQCLIQWQGNKIEIVPADRWRTQAIILRASWRIRTSTQRIISPRGACFEFAYTIKPYATNNKAEYEAVLKGLQLLKEVEADAVEIMGDSLLVIIYNEKCQKLMKEFRLVTLKHVSREQNIEVYDLAQGASGYKPMIKDVQIEVAAMTADDWRYDVHQYLQNPSQSAYRKLRYKALKYTLLDDELYYRTIDGVLLKCLSAYQAKVAIGEVHEGICGTHQSAHKMKWLLRRAGYFWPTMLEDCFRYYKGCQDCQKFGAIQRAPASAMNPIIKPWPFRGWGIDMIGMINPPSSKGHKFILVATDYFIKWVEAIPLKKADSGDAIQFVQEHIIYRFGTPQTITIDQGSIFVSDKFVQFADSMGIKLLNSSPYYAQANGQAEASNKSLIKLIKRKISDYPRQWHTRLAEALWSYRMACHGSIQVPPYKLVYGHEAVLPWEVRIGSRRTELQSDLTANEYYNLMTDEREDLVQSRLRALAKVTRDKERVARHYNKKVVPKTFLEGELVWKLILPIGTRDSKFGKWSPN
uniref:Retrotransposon polyprotein n=2 Tax=Oryza sativa subsp. japonica TaxID=39947 RepID=A0A5S6RBJ0_ORYSJ|nr:Putative retrotransposon polyprotein [Oryza sativa Japonica Group]AAN04925.1 Putative retrotransposon polyprotein [Oryza sativa Japonica Group]AAP52165.1 retrotransposon protein, putative, unclassified [Oryza sativa Japonica Group]